VFPNEPSAIDVDAVLLNLNNILRHNTAGADAAPALALALALATVKKALTSSNATLNTSGAPPRLIAFSIARQPTLCLTVM
jgi:hypothetical protein